MYLRMRCVSSHDLEDLDVGIGEGEYIGDSGESIFLFSVGCSSCLSKFGGGRFHGRLL